MGIYLNGQLVIADDLLITGDFKLLGGGNIETVANNDLTLLPNGTGITIVGDAGSTGQGLASNDDLFIAGKVEIDGTTYLDGAAIFASGSRYNDNAVGGFGTGNDAAIVYSTAQTPDTWIFAVGADSRSIIICEKADIAVDFAFPLQANPTLCIQSSDATAPAQRICGYHDQTNGVIDCGAGDLSISTVANQTLVLVQSVWGDHRVALTGVQAGGLKPPTWTKIADDGAGSVGVYGWAFADQALEANEEQLFFDAELPHGYKEGTDLDAHVHWSTATGGAAGEFPRFGLEYFWVNIDGTYTTTTIIRSDASSAATATTSADGTIAADKHYVTDLGTITGTGKSISSLLVCRVFRNSSDATDDLAQATFGHVANFHHQIDTMGSRQEYVK